MGLDKLRYGLVAVGVVVGAITLLALLILAARPAVAADPDNGEAVFETKCAGCHTIGAGKRVGPDLKGVVGKRGRDWVVGYVSTPDKVRASGDPTAQELTREYGGTMPNLGLSSGDVQAVVSYLQDQSGEEPEPAQGEQAQPSPQAEERPAAAGPAGKAEIGKHLFTGEEAFAKGGPPCIACHNVAGVGELEGGALAADLTGAYKKYGDSGLMSILKTTPFAGMKEAYAGHPLTDDEMANLKAFFAQTEGQQSSASIGWIFAVIGIAVFAIFLGIIHLVWHERLNGVRRRITGEPRK